ncbi:MAG: hypothetical protein SWQ30_12725 [Thermodesulfobacteriota bacterium]|nr:hypothetical protein [Thermodesulfobacteriota bacterium]
MTYTSYNSGQQPGQTYIASYGYESPYGGGYGYARSIDISEALEPLIHHLARYDAQRIRLEREGGPIGDFKTVTALLETPVPLKTPFGRREITLTDQQGLQGAVRAVSLDLHLEIRQLPTIMPAYYLCRTHRDYYSEYSLIVEDLHLSPGYPLLSERFVKLMDLGHENYFLRLSQFREGVASLAKTNMPDSGRSVDSILYDVGRHIFQAAWHEDQQLAVAASPHLNLVAFRQAIELLYLCLSGELCELRSAINGAMLQFFEHCYTQPAILGFLEILMHLDGDKLNNVPKMARHLYARLRQSFRRFLGAEVTGGPLSIEMPIWKRLYANFSRVGLIAKELRRGAQVMAAIRRLEEEASAVINALLTEASGGAAVRMPPYRVRV